MIQTLKSWFGFGSKVDLTIYKITACAEMPSCIGMTTQGKPVVGVKFAVTNEKEFRTFTPTSVEVIENGFILKTKYVTAQFSAT